MLRLCLEASVPSPRIKEKLGLVAITRVWAGVWGSGSQSTQSIQNVLQVLNQGERDGQDVISIISLTRGIGKNTLD